ncbi:hypothetical protein HYW67_00155 [Candidatus Parcubacteria bacterium]|nr:hypothetical protein [Candidatus Parcubacteria bacterium]
MTMTINRTFAFGIILLGALVVTALSFVLVSFQGSTPSATNVAPIPEPENQAYLPSVLNSLSGMVVKRDAGSIVMQVRIPESADASKLRAEERVVRWLKDTKFLMSDDYPTDKTPAKEIKSEDVKVGDAVVATSDENIRSSRQFAAKSVTVYGRVGDIPIGQFSLESGPVIGQLIKIQGYTLTVKFEPLKPFGDLKNPGPELIPPGTWVVRLGSSASFNKVVWPRPKSSPTPPSSSSPISITPISIGDLAADTAVAVYFSGIFFSKRRGE